MLHINVTSYGKCLAKFLTIFYFCGVKHLEIKKIHTLCFPIFYHVVLVFGVSYTQNKILFSHVSFDLCIVWLELYPTESIIYKTLFAMIRKSRNVYKRKRPSNASWN